MPQATMRDEFPDGLTSANPFPDRITQRDWEIAGAYINDSRATLRIVADKFGLSVERVRQIVGRVYLCMRRTSMYQWEKDNPVLASLPRSAVNALFQARITDDRSLLDASIEDLQQIRNVGTVSLTRIAKAKERR